MYLIQTVSSRPRVWSSHSNIYNTKDDVGCMMSSVDNIPGYRDASSYYCSPTLLRKTAATTYDFPEHPPKKDKKWSLGSLFRRKKKEESDSSSDEECDNKKGFLRRRKRDKRKKSNKQRGTFDHIVNPAVRGISTCNGHSLHDDNGILSDPTGGFASYTGRNYSTKVTALNPNVNVKSTGNITDTARVNLGSADSLNKKHRKSRTKVRAEARRERNKHNSSSDEDSQRSASSSRFRSDENLGKSRDSSLNRKSRAARTERYIRRLSKDEEAALNRENKLHPYKSESERLHRPSSSDVKENKTDFNTSPSASPISRNNTKLNVTTASNTQTVVSGLFTIPPSHISQTRNKSDNASYNSSVYNKLSTPNSNSTNKYSSLTNDHKEKEISYQRSVSYDADIHKSASPELQTVLHVQFPLTKPTNRLRNMSLVEQPRIYRNDKHPPPPPPRDPWRLVSVPNSDIARPVSYCFERAIHQNNHFNSEKTSITNGKTNVKPHSFNWHPNYRSTSEDHLASESSNITVQPRPSSAASDHFVQRFVKKPPHTTNSSDDFRYLTEKNPRSRKPIVIQSHSQVHQQQSESQKALNFWKQKDQDEISRMHVKQNVINPPSPQMFTAQTRVRTKVFLPSVLKSDMESFVEKDDHKRTSSPFKPISPEINNIPTQNVPTNRADEVKPTLLDKDTANEPPVNNRKSSNLEEALDELEAIYNSLRLGDEDLLDRAEQRELSIAAQKLQKSKDEPYPGWGIPRGAISDSSFNYEPFETIDSPKRKRLLKRSRLIDRKSDDMAYRKLNKERKESGDPKEAISKISYLLASPVHGSAPDDVDAEIFKSQGKEPDVTFDDMVYRNVKYANSSLKVCDPQPPFGIPTGPILPSANSDYLHAVPDNEEQYSFKNKKIPDLVKDDLAYRNLRKDSHKDPVLPPLMPEDFANNNNSNNINAQEFVKPDFNSLKKKRAVRSLSANLYNLIQNQTFRLRVNDEKSPEKMETNDESDKSSLADIADAMEIARQILKEKENKISETRRAFLSDTEAKYRKHVASNDNVNERRLNFLNGMKSQNGESEVYQQKIQVNVPKTQDSFLQSKPPSGIILDKKTPVKDNVFVSVASLGNVTTSVEDSVGDTAPTDSISSCNKSLEELLNAFAVEADETSKQISRELESSYEPGHTSHFTDSLFDGNKETKKATEDSKQESGELLRDKEFESATQPSEMLATTKTESMATEEVGHITPTPIIQESLANVIITRNADSNLLTPNPITSEIHSESEHDYVNLGSDTEKDIPMIDESCEETKCMSPFEERKSELIAGFQELIMATDPDTLEKKLTSVRNTEIDGAFEDGKASEGEMCDLNPDALTPMKQECAFLSKACINVSEKGTITSYITDCDIQCSNRCFLPNITISNDDFNSRATKLKPIICNFSISSETKENNSRLRVGRHNSLNESRRSSGFHSISSGNSASDVEHNLYFSSDDDAKMENFGLVNLKSLESPKLVLKSAIQLSCENISLHASTQTETETGLSLNQEVNQFLQNSVDNDIASIRATCETGESQVLERCRFNVNSNGSQKLHQSNNVTKIRENFREEETRSDDNVSPSNSRDLRHTLDTTQPTRSWYSDPIVLAFACSYGFACTYQLVSLDAVTVLGLLFVIVSFVAALIL